MTDKDLIIIDSLIERFDNLPQIIELRVKAEWEKLTEDEHNLLFETYKKLDDVLVDLKAFISVKFNNREDLIIKWNAIDFDTKIAGIKIWTNAPYAIRKAWFEGISDSRSLLKIIRAEVRLIIDSEDDKNDNTKIEKQTTIIGGHVIINEHSNRGNQNISDIDIDSSSLKNFSTKSDDKNKRSIIEILAWITGIIAAIIAIFEFLIK